MSPASQAPSSEQLLLFQPRPARPSWKSLPAVTREQTIELLTQMLSEHWTRTHKMLAEKETPDE